MEDRPAQIIPLACRFIPYDQWLITHIDTCWKISQLKAWFIAKCIASTHSSSSAPVPSFLTGELPSKPSSKPPKRPASPIVFAPEPPVRRSISPIRFAPLDSVSVAGTGTSTSFEGGLGGSSDDEGTTIAMGYEEDDEWDSDELGLGLGNSGRFASRSQYLSHFEKRPATRSVSIEHHRKESTSTSTPSTESGIQTYHPRKLMLIRFSTGQVLEDHYRVEDVNLRPYELIELQRCDVVQQLPRTVLSDYVKPFWEGWVKALRVVYRDPGSGSGQRKGKRKEQTQSQGNGKKRTKLDWKDRWVFVKDGVLHLLKDREDQATAQRFPLDSLIEIRGSEQLGRTVVNNSTRIICAKFKSTHRHRPPPPIPQQDISALYHPIMMAPYDGLPQQHVHSAVATPPFMAPFVRNRAQFTPGSGQASLNSSPGSSGTIVAASKPKASKRLVKERKVESDGGESDDERETQPQPQHPPPPSPSAQHSPPTSPLAQQPPPSDNEDEGEPRIHKHPFSSREPPDLDGSSSGSLSSPVFAHSDVDSSDEGSKPTYGYLHPLSSRRRKEKEREKDRAGVRFDPAEPGQQPEPDNSFVVVPKEEVKHDQDKANGNEWIVLDLKDDHAYKSFLRILHRHAPHTVLSTFLASFPGFSTSANTPPPDDQNDKHTPDPSPIVFAPAPNHQHQGEVEGSEAFPSTAAISSRGREWKSEPSSPLDAYRFPAHTSNIPSVKLAIEVVPYPEWRTEVVNRARHLGLGGIMRGLEYHLWGPQADTAFRFLATRSREAKKGKEKEKPKATKKKGKQKQKGPTTTGSGSDEEAFYSAGSNSGLDTSEGDSDLDGYASSDAEWVGWMADLSRQRHNLLNSTEVEEVEEQVPPMIEDRMAFEPTGVVIGPSPVVSPVVESFAYASRSTSGTWGPASGQPLSSPSSNESLKVRPRRLSFGTPGLGGAPGPGEPSSPRRTREPVLYTTGLVHFSGYESGRRPSLPFMSAIPGPLTPTPSSSLPSMEHQVKRRASLASTTTGGRLRKKDKDDRDRKGKGKERELETDNDLSTDTHSQRRPALSVSTSGHRQSSYHHTNPPTSPKLLRRMRSWEADPEGGGGGVTGINVVRNNPPVKKKGSRSKGLVREVSMRAEKLVQGLESALDFVDGRQ